MLGIIRAVMWTNGAMSLVTTVPCSPDSTGDYAIVSGWEAMVEKPRAPIPLRLLELVQKAEDANRDEEALY